MVLDLLSAPLFDVLRSGHQAAVVSGFVALLTIILFMRTDPPGGAGGLLGENDERVWAVRRPGGVHWFMASLLVIVLITLSI